jgi:hypothetical protein
MVLAASTAARRSLLWARAALNKLQGSLAQQRSTATRQGSGRSSNEKVSEASDLNQERQRGKAQVRMTF